MSSENPVSKNAIFPNVNRKGGQDLTPAHPRDISFYVFDGTTVASEMQVAPLTLIDREISNVFARFVDGLTFQAQRSLEEGNSREVGRNQHSISFTTDDGVGTRTQHYQGELTFTTAKEGRAFRKRAEFRRLDSFEINVIGEDEEETKHFYVPTRFAPIRIRYEFGRNQADTAVTGITVSWQGPLAVLDSYGGSQARHGFVRESIPREHPRDPLKAFLLRNFIWTQDNRENPGSRWYQGELRGTLDEASLHFGLQSGKGTPRLTLSQIVTPKDKPPVSLSASYTFKDCEDPTKRQLTLSPVIKTDSGYIGTNDQHRAVNGTWIQNGVPINDFFSILESARDIWPRNKVLPGTPINR
jgi:hypothetical protein